MLKPLQIADQHFPNNLIQGPLAGVSTAPFRRLAWQYGRPAFSCTEMISCKTIIHQPRLAKNRFLHIAANEGPICLQLSSHNTNEIAQAVNIVSDLGANLIDLNCGCPVKKIRQKKAGSALLANPLQLYQMITAMKMNTSLPVGIKIRVDGGSDERFNQEIVKVIIESGLDFLTVHGRHWTEHYETPCRYDEIQFFVQALKVPVIGNGDVACLTTLKKMYATGSAGVMIGRAGVGQPWLFQQLQAELQQTVFQKPTLADIAAIFIEHIEELALLFANETMALLHARKLAKYYARELSARNEFCLAINTCKTLTAFKQLCGAFFL